MSGSGDKVHVGGSSGVELTAQQQSDQDLLSQSGMGGLFFTLGAIALSLSEPLIWQHKLVAMSFLSLLAVMMGFRFYMFLTLPSMTGFLLPKVYYVCLLGNAAVWGIYAVWLVDLPKELSATSAVTITLSAGAACGGAVAMAMNLRLARALTCFYIVPTVLYSFTQYDRPQLPVLGVLLIIFLVYLWILSGKQNAAYWKMVGNTEKLRRQTQELAEARNDALRANQMRNDFLGHISQEIRAPLNGIITTANALADSPLDDRQQDQVNVILQSSKFAVGLINDVVDFSEISDVLPTTGTLDVDLLSLCNDILNVLEPAVRPQGNRIELVDHLQGRYWIKVDLLRLQQLVTNLLSNANRFTSSGRIELHLYHMAGARADQELIRCEVHDEGPIISAAEQRQLMETYHETGRVAPNARGAGLGLAICSRLIRLLGGRLGIKTDHKNSCFWFEIPYVPGTPRVVGKPMPAKASNIDPALVLVVEDNLVSQKVMSAYLNKLQYPYQLADTGKQALAVWERHHPRFVLLDYGLPDSSGLEVAQKIRALEREQGLTPCNIILVTAHKLNNLIEECLAAGMNDHLPKPVTLRMLQSMLDKWS